MDANDWSDVQVILDELKNDSKALTRSIHEICWLMRGSLSRNDAWSLSPEERENIYGFVQENMKRFEKSPYPII